MLDEAWPQTCHVGKNCFCSVTSNRTSEENDQAAAGLRPSSDDSIPLLQVDWRRPELQREDIQGFVRREDHCQGRSKSDQARDRDGIARDHARDLVDTFN